MNDWETSWTLQLFFGWCLVLALVLGLILAGIEATATVPLPLP